MKTTTRTTYRNVCELYNTVTRQNRQRAFCILPTLFRVCVYKLRRSFKAEPSRIGLEGDANGDH